MSPLKGHDQHPGPRLCTGRSRRYAHLHEELAGQVSALLHPRRHRRPRLVQHQRVPRPARRHRHWREEIAHRPAVGAKQRQGRDQGQVMFWEKFREKLEKGYSR